jgi:hypothetical protein
VSNLLTEVQYFSPSEYERMYFKKTA